MVDGGHGNDGAPRSDGRVPIILVCSTADVELADGAAAGLRSRGFDVAVMGAAEDGSNRLAEVVERFERQGLYVLCRGGELDRDGIDRLRATLRSLEVPFGRTLTLPTAQGGSRGLEERVVSVARRMVTGRFERTQTPIVSDADASQPDPRAAPIDPTAADSVDPADVDRWADSLAGGKAPQLEAAPDAAFSEDLPTAIVGAPIGSGDEAGLETDPSLPAGTDDYEPIDRTMVTRHPIPDALEREESSAPTTATPSLPEDDDIDASAFSSGPNIRLIVGGGVALVLIIVLAVALSGSDDGPDDASPTDDVVASAEDAAPKDSVDAKQSDAQPEETPTPAEAKTPPAPSAEEPPESEPPESEPPEAAAEPAAPDEADEAAGDAPEAALEQFDLEGAEKALAHRSAVDLALLDDSPLPPSAPEDRAAIAQALEEREIRSWNAFLIAGDDAPNLVFKDAELFCKTLSAGGISGWRLPSIGELLSLSGAKLLDRKGIFWSETPGDAFGDTRMVVNAKKGSTASVKTDWDGARPICVRVRE